MDLNQFTQLFPRANNAIYYAIDTFTTQYQIPNLTMFLAQCSEESGRFTQLKENLNYSASRLIAVWPTHFNHNNAYDYAYQPEKLANFIYANRLGNGNVASGDGWQFRGRGCIQLTGRNLYTQFAASMNTDPISTAIYMETPSGAVESACWYWMKIAKVDKYFTRADIPTVTKIINGGLINLQNRYNEFDRIKQVLP